MKENTSELEAGKEGPLGRVHACTGLTSMKHGKEHSQSTEPTLSARSLLHFSLYPLKTLRDLSFPFEKEETEIQRATVAC